MGVETAVAAGLAISAATAAASTAQQVQQNRAARGAVRSARRAQRVLDEQNREQAIIEGRRARRRASEIRGRIRAAAGEAGVGTEGGFGRALDVVTAAELEDLALIGLNQEAFRSRAQSETEAIIARSRGFQSNPILAGLSGGVGGAQSGLAIVEGVDRLNRPRGSVP